MSGGLPDPARPLRRLKWSDGAAAAGTRVIAEECAVAITYNRETYAVMMASPTDLEDFAIGFSLSEAIIDHPSEIEEMEIIVHPGEGHPDGIEARMT